MHLKLIQLFTVCEVCNHTYDTFYMQKFPCETWGSHSNLYSLQNVLGIAPQQNDNTNISGELTFLLGINLKKEKTSTLKDEAAFLHMPGIFHIPSQCYTQKIL